MSENLQQQNDGKTEDLNFRLYSKSEAAKLLGIGKEKLGKLINSGRIGFIQIEDRIHIPHEEIQKFIYSNTIRLSQESVRQTLKQHNSKQKVQTPIDKEFNSISLFNNILETKTNGKHLH